MFIFVEMVGTMLIFIKEVGSIASIGHNFTNSFLLNTHSGSFFSYF